MSIGYTVILGASGGLGSALAREVRERGGRPVLAGRSEQRLADLAAELDAPVLEVDGTDAAALDAALSGLVERDRGQPITAVAGCIGSLFLAPAHATDPADFAEVVHVNLGSAFAAVRAGARAMLRSGGSIALVSSVAAEVGMPNHEAIAAAKAGVSGLVRAAAASYAPRGIRVNAVAPGLMETPMTARLLGSEAARAASEAMHPLGRIGEPTDVAGVMAWLLDERSSWVTGQVLGVDGGLSRVRPRS